MCFSLYTPICFAGLDLVADINFRSRIGAYKHHCQPRLPLPLGKRGGAILPFRKNLIANPLSVEYLGHASALLQLDWDIDVGDLLMANFTCVCNNQLVSGHWRIENYPSLLRLGGPMFRRRPNQLSTLSMSSVTSG